MIKILLAIFFISSCGQLKLDIEESKTEKATETEETKEEVISPNQLSATKTKTYPEKVLPFIPATIENKPHKLFFLADVLENGKTCLEVAYNHATGIQESISIVAEENCVDSTITLNGIKGKDGIGCQLEDYKLICDDSEINFTELLISGPQGDPGKDAEFFIEDYEDENCFNGIMIITNNHNNNFYEKIICSGRDGIDGEQGIPGGQGLQGERGKQGIQGEIGLTGDKGGQGIQGESGELGLSGNDGTDGINGISSLILTKQIDQEGGCLFSEGIRITTGLDMDANGILSPYEITATDYVCQPIYDPAYPVITFNDITLGYLEQSDYQTYYQVMGIGEIENDPTDDIFFILEQIDGQLEFQNLNDYIYFSGSSCSDETGLVINKPIRNQLKYAEIGDGSKQFYNFTIEQTSFTPKSKLNSISGNCLDWSPNQTNYSGYKAKKYSSTLFSPYDTLLLEEIMVR